MVMFAPLVINSLVYVTQYIYIMYISISNIYIIHIYLSTPEFQCTSSHALGRPVPPLSFTVTPSTLFFLAFLFFLSCPPEDITKIYVFFFFVIDAVYDEIDPAIHSKFFLPRFRYFK